MGCGCKKNKDQSNNENQPAAADTAPIQTNETPPENVEFRKQEAQKQSKLTMMQSFASAIASRGFNNEKVTQPIKQLRVLSCFGNQTQGGILPPCEHLKQSTTPGKFYCGGCGCGDRKGTWLVSDGDEYSKLDYPRLTCPLQMPGFSNYEKSKPDEAESPITRRYYIEQLPFAEIQKIPVTTHDLPIKPKEEQKQEVKEEQNPPEQENKN